MNLRDYQNECIHILHKDIPRQLIQLPTGSGKTLIFLSYLHANSKCGLIVVPSIDLLNQVYETALAFYSPNEIFKKDCAKIPRNKKLYILVAMSLKLDSTRDYFRDIKLDHIIIDEAHRSMSDLYLNFLNFYQEINPFKLIGFTATPERGDKQSLLKLFDSITYKKSIFDLIKEGFLCDLECYRIHTKLKLESDGKTPDFKSMEIERLDVESRNELIFNTYNQYCSHKKTLIFCLSVDHSKKIAEHFKAQGISCAHISGYQTPSERKRILKAFKSGEIQVLTNCQLLTEGFDEPSIEALIIARPTKSKALYCQMIGRGTRLYKDKKICSVYELTDNCHRICTFNVAAHEDKDARFIREYPQGIRLSELHEQLQSISLEEYSLEKSKVSLIDTFNSYLQSVGASDYQLEKLREFNIPFAEKLNFSEASFILFLQRLREQYGYNIKK